jgi:hypothetical protein
MKPFMDDIPWPHDDRRDFDDVPFEQQVQVRKFKPLEPRHLSTSHIINRMAWCWRFLQHMKMGLYECPPGLEPLDERVLETEISCLRGELEVRQRAHRRRRLT